MLHWHYPIFRVWSEVIAIFLTLTFVLPYLTWAFEPGRYGPNHPGAINIQYKGKALALPEKLGTIDRGFQGHGKIVVHIKDLHCNYEVQKNIAGIIHHLAKKHTLRLVGEEGAFYTVNTTKISTFPLKKIREQVSDYFVKQGKLTGAEYYSGTGEFPIRLEGIETPDLYRAGQQAVCTFLNNESQGYCYDLREIFDALKAKIYNPLLQRFDARRREYRRGKLDLLEYCAFLRTTAGRLKLDLSLYTNLSKFLSLKQNSFSLKVDPDRLFQEMDILDMAVRQRLYSSEKQRSLDNLYRRLDIIEKLLNISVSAKDLSEFRSCREDFSVQVFVKAIRSYDETGGQLPEPHVYALDGYLKAAEDFYRIADERSTHFVNNLCRKMDRFGEKLAVMITGGFHTEKVLQELERRNISYISVTPRLTRYDAANPYFSLLQNRQLPLEKLLSGNQSIMAVRTSCPDIFNLNPNAVVKISRIKNLGQRNFAKMQDVLFKSAAILTFYARGVKIRDIPEELEMFLKTYLANNPLLNIDSKAFIRANQEAGRQGQSNQSLLFVIIPLRAGEKLITSVSFLAKEIMLLLKDSKYDLKTIPLGKFRIYFPLDNGDISGLINEMRSRRPKPMVVDILGLVYVAGAVYIVWIVSRKLCKKLRAGFRYLKARALILEFAGENNIKGGNGQHLTATELMEMANRKIIVDDYLGEYKGCDVGDRSVVIAVLFSDEECFNILRQTVILKQNPGSIYNYSQALNIAIDEMKARKSGKAPAFPHRDKARVALSEKDVSMLKKAFEHLEDSPAALEDRLDDSEYLGKGYRRMTTTTTKTYLYLMLSMGFIETAAAAPGFETAVISLLGIPGINIAALLSLTALLVFSAVKARLIRMKKHTPGTKDRLRIRNRIWNFAGAA